MTRNVRAAAALAVVAAPFLLGACESRKCWRMGYERTGTTVEQGRIDLAEAMSAAAASVPAPPPTAPSDAVNRAERARVDVTSAEMQRRGYTPVRIPVDCDTGASLDQDR